MLPTFDALITTVVDPLFFHLVSIVGQKNRELGIRYWLAILADDGKDQQRPAGMP